MKILTNSLKVCKKLTTLGLGSIMAASAMVPLAQAADQWRMHHVWVDSRAEAKHYQNFVNYVNEEAEGELNIQLFSGGSLGVADADMLRILPRGNVIQAAGLYPGYLSRDRPDYSYTLPPGVVTEAETLRDMLPTLHDIYQETYDEVGIELLGFIGHAGRDSHIMCKEPINSLEELRSKRVRVWEQFHVDVFESLGISAQVIGQNDLYMAMQTGVVDCAVYPVSLAISVSLQEVAPYASYLFPYVLHPLNILASNKSMDALPEDVQEVVRSAAKRAQEESFDDYVSGVEDERAIAVLLESGGELLEPFSEADRMEFTNAARALWQELSNEAGPKAQENYQRLSGLLE